MVVVRDRDEGLASQLHELSVVVLQVPANDWPLLLKTVLDLRVASTQLQELEWRCFVALLLDELLHVEYLSVLAHELVPVALQLVGLLAHDGLHLSQDILKHFGNLLLYGCCVFLDPLHLLLDQAHLSLDDFFLFHQCHVVALGFMLCVCKGLLDRNGVVLVAAILHVLDYTLTAVSLGVLVRVELVHFLMLIAKAEFPGLVLDADPLMLGEDFVFMHRCVVLAAEVDHVVDAVDLCLVSADCAVPDLGLGVLVERVDFDLGRHLVEQTDLLTVVDSIRLAEQTRILLLFLQVDGVIVFWHRLSGEPFSFIWVCRDWLHVGSAYGDFE